MFERYAIYFTPQGDLARAGAAWLGWDVRHGTAVPHPQLAGLDLAALTATPRKYGFHGTMKPPFHLDAGSDAADLSETFARFCAQAAPVVVSGLAVTRLGGFVALTPEGPQTELAALASDVVRHFDRFRAPATARELSRRRARLLTPAQNRNLRDWGYPHVMDQFRFHMTLTGRVDNADEILPAVAAHFAPCLPQPFVLDGLTLVGQRSDGMFQEIRRAFLGGQAT